MKTKKGTTGVRANHKKPHQSTTADILGHVATVRKPLVRIAAKWRPYYDRLIALRDRLTNQVGGLAKEAVEEISVHSMHMADAGTDNYDRDFALSLLSSGQNVLYEITEAIKRIENGTYGICEVTGKSIPRERLKAVPWARFTTEAEKQLERDGALGRTRLTRSRSVVEAGSGESGDEEESED